MTSFNEFLASEDGRENLNNAQAKLFLENLARNGVTIRFQFQLWDFMDAHLTLFREITAEDKRNGLQTSLMMWNEYERWKTRDEPPLRKLDARYFCRHLR